MLQERSDVPNKLESVEALLVCVRSQVQQNNEIFEEVTLLDLKMRYGSTEAGKAILQP